jgi:hypothetical protein
VVAQPRHHAKKKTTLLFLKIVLKIKKVKNKKIALVEVNQPARGTVAG